MAQLVRVTALPEAAQVTLGSQLTVSLTVQNADTRDACYLLAISGVPADWYDLDQPRVSVRSGASAQVLLTVHPPAGTVTTAGSYTIIVQVTVEDDLAIHTAAMVALTVRTASGLDLHVEPTDVEGRTATFQVTYRNQLPAPVALALAAQATEEGLSFRPEPAEPVIVPAGGASSITVRVVPKVRETIGAPHAYGIVFRALQVWAAPGSNPDLVRLAGFMYVPPITTPVLRTLPVWVRRLPAWTLPLPLALLLLLLALAGNRTLARSTARTAVAPMPTPTRVTAAVQPTRPQATAAGRPTSPSRPSIRRFTLVHPRPGQPYELVWQTSAAQSVTLDGRPVSAQGAVVLPAPLHSALYRLVVNNGAHRTTAQLHVVVDAPTADPHAVVLTTPEIATFAVRRRQGQLYVIWRVRDAVYVRLQGQLVAPASARPMPPGASRLRLVASNDVGSRQGLLQVASAQPTATPHPRPTPTPTARPTRTATPWPTVTAMAHPRRLLSAHPPAAATARPTRMPTATPRPTWTATTRPTATTTPRRAVTATAYMRRLLPAHPTTTTATAAPQPAILLNPDAVHFGQQRVGSTGAVHTVYVVDLGPTRLAITGVFITGDDPGDFAESDSCAGASLSISGGCAIRVRFTPLTSGTRSATLVIVDNAAGSPQTVPLRGYG